MAIFKLDETARIDTKPYENSHGIKPSGIGMWAFSWKKNPNIANHKEVYMTHGLYDYAKNAAVQRFPKSTVLYVIP